MLDFPKMCPTLKSCISELNEYFFKISKDLKRSVSKLYNEPNTIKNGHLTQKLCSMKDIKFSKKCEKELKHPHTDGVVQMDFCEFSEKLLSSIARNFRVKCPFLIVLGSLESLDIDLCNGTGPIAKYFLSSEIQLLKVG